MGRLVDRDSRGEHVGSAGQERLEDPLQRADRLAFAKHHFGITAAATAVQIDLGLVEISRGRQGRFEQEIGQLEPSGE